MHINATRIIVTTALAFGLHTAHAASVNGVVISDTQVTAALQQARLPDTPQARAVIKQQLIASELFRQEAVKDKGLEARPDVQQSIRDAKNTVLTSAWLKEHIKPAPVTDAQVKARYDAIVASLGDKEYKARLIQVADEASAQVVLARVRRGEDFATLAQEMSLAPNKASGGLIDWISFKVPVQEGKTQNLPLPIAQAIASLPASTISATPIAWNNASYLVKVEEIRPTEVPAYDKAKSALQQALQAQALERATTALVTQLLAKAKITQ